MLRRTVGIVVCSVAIGALGLLSASAAEKKSDIKDGIEGKIVKVDVDKGSVTIADENGKERSFSITDETVIVGPRGGIVHKRLKDPRFHKGLSITVVAMGSTAAQLHLGYDRKSKAGSGASTSSSSGSSSTSSSSGSTTSSTSTSGTSSSKPTPRTSGFRGVLGAKPAAGKEEAKTDEAEDEDSEFPGKVKSVDPAKRILVITLVTGKDHSFLLPGDVKVTVNGRVSRRGLNDAALKVGTSLTVVTEAGGRKVKEVKVASPTARRMKKAA